ncbi:MAG: hypothetical protein ACREQ5_29915 [Candidatus Dormibacteria bacterium]
MTAVIDSRCPAASCVLERWYRWLTADTMSSHGRGDRCRRSRNVSISRAIG